MNELTFFISWEGYQMYKHHIWFQKKLVLENTKPITMQKNCEKIVIIILVSKTTVGKIYVGIIEFEVNYAWGVMV